MNSGSVFDQLVMVAMKKISVILASCIVEQERQSSWYEHTSGQFCKFLASGQTLLLLLQELHRLRIHLLLDNWKLDAYVIIPINKELSQAVR